MIFIAFLFAALACMYAQGNHVIAAFCLICTAICLALE